MKIGKLRIFTNFFQSILKIRKKIANFNDFQFLKFF